MTHTVHSNTHDMKLCDGNGQKITLLKTDLKSGKGTNKEIFKTE